MIPIEVQIVVPGQINHTVVPLPEPIVAFDLVPAAEVSEALVMPVEATEVLETQALPVAAIEVPVPLRLAVLHLREVQDLQADAAVAELDNSPKSIELINLRI